MEICELNKIKKKFQMKVIQILLTFEFKIK